MLLLLLLLLLLLMLLMLYRIAGQHNTATADSPSVGVKGVGRGCGRRGG